MKDTTILISNPMEGMRSPTTEGRGAHPFFEALYSRQDPGCTFCRQDESLLLKLQIPFRGNLDKTKEVVVYREKETLFLWSSEEGIRNKMKDLLKQLSPDESGITGILLIQILSEDLGHLQEMEKRADQLEACVMSGYCPEFNRQILPMKRELSRFSRYYNQLRNLFQEISEPDPGELLGITENEGKRLENKVDFLAQETQGIREYVMQVQEVYQSEIEIRQNDVMRLLTSVTTFFLPLTLIAGWYGMNFEFMPEISSRYGYPAVILVSVVIVIICIILFKKKKFW